jgi:hypothetical protein
MGSDPVVEKPSHPLLEKLQAALEGKGDVDDTGCITIPLEELTGFFLDLALRVRRLEEDNVLLRAGRL